jgi:hypothetical protein
MRLVEPMRDQRMGSVLAGPFGESVGKIAKRGASGYSDQPKCHHRDASACPDTIQEQYRADHRGNQDGGKGNAGLHVASVDHVNESVTRARAPRPNPRKKPKAVARSISTLLRPSENRSVVRCTTEETRKANQRGNSARKLIGEDATKAETNHGPGGYSKPQTKYFLLPASG